MRQLTRPCIEIAVGEARILEHDSDCIGGFRRLRREKLRQGRGRDRACERHRGVARTGRWIAMPPFSRTWMNGSRLDTTITSAPRSSRSRISRSVSGVHESRSSSRSRCSDSRSRISVRRSSAIGCSSDPGRRDDGRSSPSPRISARIPCTHPRQLSWATTTVITEITAPSPTKK